VKNKKQYSPSIVLLFIVQSSLKMGTRVQTWYIVSIKNRFCKLTLANWVLIPYPSATIYSRVTQLQTKTRSIRDHGNDRLDFLYPLSRIYFEQTFLSFI
jgi:hypothetical protein